MVPQHLTMGELQRPATTNRTLDYPGKGNERRMGAAMMEAVSTVEGTKAMMKGTSRQSRKSTVRKGASPTIAALIESGTPFDSTCETTSSALHTLSPICPNSSKRYTRWKNWAVC